MKDYKRILITGASRGLGRALAFRFGQQGARLALVARGRDELTKVVDELNRRGVDALAIVADLGKPNDPQRIAAMAFEYLNHVDLLIHNASTLGPTPLPALSEIDDGDFEEVFQVGVLGPQRLTRAIAGNMALRGRGTILAVSSDAAVEAYPGWGAYSAAKAAQDHLVRIWGEECRDLGLRFLSVDPGEMATEMHAAALPEADPATLDRPELVASRIEALLRDSTVAAHGERVLASQWELR